MKLRFITTSLVLLAARAEAYDFTVDSTTTLQAYDVAGPGGSPTLARRRILQTLRLGAYGLIAPRPRAPRLSIVLALRLDSDFGIEDDEIDPDAVDGRFAPGLERHEIDLTYGWIEGQGFLDGWLGFRVGRQLVTDSLGWYAFDGALVRCVTPFWLELEAYGGVEVRGGTPSSPSTFELDGVQRARRDGLDPTEYPTIEEPAVAPVIGAALETTGQTWATARLSFREVESEGRVQERRAGISANVTPLSRLTVRGSTVWDIHLSFVSEVTGGLEAELADRLVSGVEYVRFTPTFDGDSIWNFFPVEPMNDVRLYALFEPVSGLNVTGLAFGRLFSSPSSEKSAGDESVTDLGGALTVRGHNRIGELAARLHGSDGEGGLRLGADLGAQRRLANDRYRLTGRVSLWRWRDEIRRYRNGTTFAWVLGGQLRVSRPATLLCEIEHEINHVVGSRFRALGLLDLRFSL